ncbi:MAG: endolytic transglycosylase MltG [bacterium]|nr:endolytic transglycosylase MltG [bacterium]
MNAKLNSKKYQKKLKLIAGVMFAAFCLLFIWSIYVPKSLSQEPVVLHTITDGLGDEDIARELEEKGVIASSLMFKMYVTFTGQQSKLQAGLYDLSPSMSVAAIVNKLVKGDIAKRKVTIIEGWDLEDIGKYLENKKIYSKKDFLDAANKDYSKEFSFLAGKPKDIGLEGFIFPDTYYVPLIYSPEQFVKLILGNFDKKLTPELRAQIAKDKRTIFGVVTMASILEKEVPSLVDKKIVAGILWKRIGSGMPLQVDSTVNYVTGKSDLRVAIKDLQADSPYNTYKYKGLPKGPISSPGMNSILGAIYPTKSPYWFYLSAKGTGQTIFSKTYRDHTISIEKYLNS